MLTVNVLISEFCNSFLDFPQGSVVWIVTGLVKTEGHA